MKQKYFWLVPLLLLVSCYPKQDPNLHATIEANFWQTQTALPTLTPTLTKTPRPINSFQLTSIPASAVIPEPIFLSGNGDSSVNIEKWDEAAIAVVSYTGSNNFMVKNFNSYGDNLDLLVNTIGSYRGTVPIDFLEWEQTTRIDVETIGPWEIVVYPLAYVRSEQIPSIFTGSGDDVVLLYGGEPHLLKANVVSDIIHFSIWAYISSGRELLVSMPTPFQGTIVLDNSTTFLSISAGGNWTVEITTK